MKRTLTLNEEEVISSEEIPFLFVIPYNQVDFGIVRGMPVDQRQPYDLALTVSLKYVQGILKVDILCSPILICLNKENLEQVLYQFSYINTLKTQEHLQFLKHLHQSILFQDVVEGARASTSQLQKGQSSLKNYQQSWYRFKLSVDKLVILFSKENVVSLRVPRGTRHLTYISSLCLDGARWGSRVGLRGATLPAGFNNTCNLPFAPNRRFSAASSERTSS